MGGTLLHTYEFLHIQERLVGRMSRLASWPARNAVKLCQQKKNKDTIVNTRSSCRITLVPLLCSRCDLPPSCSLFHILCLTFKMMIPSLFLVLLLVTRSDAFVVTPTTTTPRWIQSSALYSKSNRVNFAWIMDYHHRQKED